jgi:DNA-binding response OmpR family regulator
MVTAFDREAMQILGPDAGGRIVHKPFEPDQLLGMVQDILAAHA